MKFRQQLSGYIKKTLEVICKWQEDDMKMIFDMYWETLGENRGIRNANDLKNNDLEIAILGVIGPGPRGFVFVASRRHWTWTP